jgi:type II secretory pathway component PulF
MSALSSYLQAGVPMAKAMWEISEKGNLYTRSRVDLVLFNLRQGLNFGESLHETGLNYPDPVIIDAMRVYSELPTFQKLLKESSSKWLDIVLVSAKKQSKIMNTIAKLIIGGIIMWIVYVTAVSIPLQINSFVVMHMGGGM